MSAYKASSEDMEMTLEENRSMLLMGNCLWRYQRRDVVYLKQNAIREACVLKGKYENYDCLRQ